MKIAENNFWEKLKRSIIGLAPMDGITDYPTRQIQASIAKPDVMYTEFINVDGLIRNPDYFNKKMKFGKNERPIIAQVFGSDPNCFYEAVSMICEFNFNGIDINMGCPARKVLGNGGGGALIGNYFLVEKIIGKCLDAIKNIGKHVPLSIKTRIGKAEIITSEWISFLADFPIAEVTVHGRLFKQANSGPVNWKEIRKAAEILHKKNIVCLGNGEIKSIQEGKMFSEKFGVDGVLIGQAALGNPWVFKENYIPGKEEVFKTILKHAKLAWNFYGPAGFVTVRKHFGWYPKGFTGASDLRTELMKTNNPEEVESVLKN